MSFGERVDKKMQSLSCARDVMGSSAEYDSGEVDLVAARTLAALEAAEHQGAKRSTAAGAVLGVGLRESLEVHSEERLLLEVAEMLDVDVELRSESDDQEESAGGILEVLRR